MAVRKSFGFKIPDTGQGRNIKKAVDALFTDDLPQTESWALFENMAQRPPLFAAHRRQVAGAIAMIVNGGLTLEQEELLTKAHRDIQITGEQFGQVSTMLLGRLAWVGETEAVNVLQELAPRIQQLWVKE